MGYACPVCGDPQADAVHLANHLAFTALARGGDHEDWLDERVPDWEQLDEEALGERVVESAEETEFPQVFEDTTGGHGHAGHDHGGDGSTERAAGEEDGTVEGARARADAFTGESLEDASDIFEEARELTRERQERADSETE